MAERSVRQPKVLPMSIISQADVTQLIRELKDFDQMSRQAALAKRSPSVGVSHASDLLRDVAEELDCSLTTQTGRKQLMSILTDLQDNAPVVHFSFAAPVHWRELRKIATWFRREVDPKTLLDVSVQPGIVAGCTLRTTSRFFDYSIKSAIDANHGALKKRIRQMAEQV